MTKAEHERRERLLSTLQSLGFTLKQSEALRRISNTLRRWYELECGDGHGCIERDETSNKPYWVNSYSGRRYPTPDRETGASNRLMRIIADHGRREGNRKLRAFIQTDPRGAALYILRPGDVPAGCNPDSYYSRGICVY